MLLEERYVKLNHSWVLSSTYPRVVVLSLSYDLRAYLIFNSGLLISFCLAVTIVDPIRFELDTAVVRAGE